MIEKFVSIKNVISKVYRDLHLEDESRFQDMIEWSAEAMEQIGSFSQYEHKAETFEVNSDNFTYVYTGTDKNKSHLLNNEKI